MCLMCKGATAVNISRISRTTTAVRSGMGRSAEATGLFPHHEAASLSNSLSRRRRTCTGRQQQRATATSYSLSSCGYRSKHQTLQPCGTDCQKRRHQAFAKSASPNTSRGSEFQWLILHRQFQSLHAHITLHIIFSETGYWSSSSAV